MPIQADSPIPPQTGGAVSRAKSECDILRKNQKNTAESAEYCTSSQAAGKGGVLAKLCGILCNQSEFRTFLMRRWPDADVINTAAQAAEFVRLQCEVQSRKCFDLDAEAAERFHDRIRIPYVNWQLGRR
ncbi:MAG: hypothetical protein GAK35_02627 [Herbaspirillum frisingense]|uniref:Uncharacterized protein n=1 Tax=Herbaspirillum frisingense TaxID=92645 RepID=A0A7V8FVQ2_9BURK|nr:MAG: hypothetical protein GAK35_02627 [Herbaspirillum frisingense]